MFDGFVFWLSRRQGLARVAALHAWCFCPTVNSVDRRGGVRFYIYGCAPAHTPKQGVPCPYTTPPSTYMDIPFAY